MKKEINYDFRKRVSEIHEKNIRNDSLKAENDEFEIFSGSSVIVSENAGDVILTAARDFIDYLFTSMQVSVSLVAGITLAKPGDIILATANDTGEELGEYAVYKGVVTTIDDCVRITGFDERGVAQGIFFAEDIMNIRKAPFLKRGTFPRKPMYSPCMVHSGFGLDEYPNEYLNAIAHEGRDAILIFAKDVDTTPYGYLDFNDLIRRARKYGIDVYAYSYLKSELHPDELGAEAYYENSYGKLFRYCPGLKGVTLVGESVEFPSKDSHTSGRSFRENTVEGIPVQAISPGWYPCCDYPKWLELLKKVITKYKKDADIVFWTYNWGFQPEEARIALINSLPKGITLQATFEMCQQYKLGDVTEYCADYTLSFCGPGGYFKSEAEAAKKRGIKLYSMTNTGGLTWDFGVIPFEPFPHQWIKRYKEMEKAHDEWGLSGLMESHHYGFYPSFISKLSKWTFSEPRIAPEKLLTAILKSEYGEKNASEINRALKLWSEAITHYTPTEADQYGAFRVGPSYPLTINARIPMQSYPYAMFGGSICYSVYAEQMTSEVCSFISLRISHEINSLKCMRSLMDEGIKVMEKLENKNEKLYRLINLGKFISHSITTGIHAKELYILKGELKTARTREELYGLLDKIEALIKTEIKNAEETIPIVEVDSRLGWEPSMEYMTDKEHLLWKIRAEEYVLQTEIANIRKSIAL